MGMDWLSASEVVAGLVITRRISPDLIDPRDMITPYDEMIRLFMKAVPADDSLIIQTIGLQPYSAAVQAAESVARTDIAQYIPLLENLATSSQVGAKLKATAASMMRGEPIDLPRLKADLAPLETGLNGFVPISEVEPRKVVWKPAFLADKYLGGLIDGGLHIIGAPPGTGKTTYVMRLISRQAMMGLKVAVFSLEMPSTLFVYRLMAVEPMLTQEHLKNILISDGLYDYLEVYATIGQLAMQHPDLYAIYIDFADMMIPPSEEESAGVSGKIYRTMAFAAKRCNVPIVLLSQLSGSYVGGTPKVHHIRYTRLAEAMASTILLLYNPNQLYAEMGASNEKNPLVCEPGKAWIIFGKSRYGYPAGNMGAVKLDWADKGRGWDDTNPLWITLNNV